MQTFTDLAALRETAGVTPAETVGTIFLHPAHTEPQLRQQSLCRDDPYNIETQARAPHYSSDDDGLQKFGSRDHGGAWRKAGSKILLD